MNAVQAPMLGKVGRFGNWVKEYLYAVSYAVFHGVELQTPEWIGERVFQICNQKIVHPGESKPVLNWDGRGVIALPMFWDFPDSLVEKIRPERIARFVLTFKPEFSLDRIPSHNFVVHYRGTDWKMGKHLPWVTLETVLAEIETLGVTRDLVVVVSDEKPTSGNPYTEDMAFLYDFQLMVNAKTLFTYPISTFSKMASLLNTGNVFESVLAGNPGDTAAGVFYKKRQ